MTDWVREKAKEDKWPFFQVMCTHHEPATILDARNAQQGLISWVEPQPDPGAKKSPSYCSQCPTMDKVLSNLPPAHAFPHASHWLNQKMSNLSLLQSPCFLTFMESYMDIFMYVSQKGIILSPPIFLIFLNHWILSDVFKFLFKKKRITFKEMPLRGVYTFRSLK